jgi:hypothetical protein
LIWALPNSVLALAIVCSYSCIGELFTIGFLTAFFTVLAADLLVVFLAAFFPARFTAAFFRTIIGSPILLSDYVMFDKLMRIMPNTDWNL